MCILHGYHKGTIEVDRVVTRASPAFDIGTAGFMEVSLGCLLKALCFRDRAFQFISCRVPALL